MRILPAGICATDQALAHRKRRARWHGRRDFGGNQSELADRLRQRELRTSALDKKPHEHIQTDDRQSYDRRSLGFIFIAIWNHCCCSSCTRRAVCCVTAAERLLTPWPVCRSIYHPFLWVFYA